MPLNGGPTYDERMYPALKSRALETLSEIMDDGESDRDRRIAAIALLRYFAAVEDPRRNSPRDNGPRPPGGGKPAPMPSSQPVAAVPTYTAPALPAATPRAAAAPAPASGDTSAKAPCNCNACREKARIAAASRAAAPSNSTSTPSPTLRLSGQPSASQPTTSAPWQGASARGPAVAMFRSHLNSPLNRAGAAP